MHTKPFIAVSTQFESDPERYSLRSDYVAMLADAGAQACILPSFGDAAALEQALSRFDGLMIPGGDDIDPRTYGSVPMGSARQDGGTFNPQRDLAERNLITAAVRLDMPFLGICRGMQMACVTFGGTLIQDISTCVPGALDHWQNADPALASHSVEVDDTSLLGGIVDRTKFRVNSLHHQCVDDAGAGCIPCAFSEDGLVEAVCRPSSRFFLGVQWHPEMSRAAHSSKAIANAFVSACVEYARMRDPR